MFPQCDMIVRKDIVVILSSLFLFLPFLMFGQSARDSESLLTELKRQMSSYAASHIVFDFRANNSEGDLLVEQSGEFVAQGDSFRMTTPLLDIYCDGKSKWILDNEMLEMMIFPHDSSDDDITENPFVVLKNLNLPDYKFPKRAKVIEEEYGLVQVVELTPKEKDINYISIFLYFSTDTSELVALEYHSRSGETYFVKIDSLEGIKEKSSDYFVPDDTLLDNSDLYITDLR